MSNLQNPIFDSEKEFLERQKLEYKNALMSDVAVIKDQSTEIGKKVLLAGGALAGVWMVSKLFGSSKKKKKKKKAKAARKLLQQQTADTLAGAYVQHIRPSASGHMHDDVTFGSPLDFSQPDAEKASSFYNTPAQYSEPENRAVPANYALHNHYHAAKTAAKAEKPGLGEELLKALTTQVTAFLLIYLSKKAEEFLLKNTDIAGKASETPDADLSYEANAGKPYL